MRLVVIAACLAAPSASWADCARDLELFSSTVSGSGYRVVEPGSLTENNERCQLSGLVLQEDTLLIEAGQINWSLTGLDELLAGAPEIVDFSVNVEGARIVPQSSDPWMNYYLDLQNRHNFIDIVAVASWSASSGDFEIKEFSVDLPGANGFSLRSFVTGMTPESVTLSPAGLGQLTLEGVSVTLENEVFLDGLALGAFLGAFSGLPGEPRSIVDATLSDLRTTVESWPGDIFPPDSKAALSALIAAGPIPWGRREIELSQGVIPLDRFLALALVAEPYSADAVSAAWQGATFDVVFQVADPSD